MAFTSREDNTDKIGYGGGGGGAGMFTGGMPGKAAPKSSTYTIKKGDNFWKLAEKNKPKGMSTDKYWRELLKANPKSKLKSGDPNLIYPGEKVVIPKVAVKTSAKKTTTTTKKTTSKPKGKK